MSGIYLQALIEGIDWSDRVELAEVEESDFGADITTLRLSDPGAALGQALHEGLTVEISLGRPDRHASLFRGTITGLEVHLPARGLPKVTIRATDGLILLGLEPRTRRWRNATLSQIVAEVASEGHLRPGTIEVRQDPHFDEHRPLTQIDETDLALLYRLGSEHDCQVWLDREDRTDALCFMSTSLLLDASPIEVALRLGENVEEFAIRREISATAPGHRVVSTDPSDGRRVEGGPLESTSYSPYGPVDLSRSVQGDERLGQILARSAAARSDPEQFRKRPGRLVGASSRPASDTRGTAGRASRRLGQTAYGRAAGDVLLRPRRRVRVEGLGVSWSGDWYLSRVLHIVDTLTQSYETAFTCTR